MGAGLTCLGGGEGLKFGGGGVVKKRESPDFRSLEVGISVIMSKSQGCSPIKVTGVLVVPFRGLNLCIGTAQGAKTENECFQSFNISVIFMTILSKRSWKETVQKLFFLSLKFAVPVIKYVVVKLGGNEFGTRP